jgi:hypothetical protein
MRRAPDRRERIGTALLGLALGAAVWTPSAAQPNPTDNRAAASSATPTAAPRQALIATGDAPDLFLLYTGDVIGYLDPCG